jgi:ribonuclease R
MAAVLESFPVHNANAATARAVQGIAASLKLTYAFPAAVQAEASALAASPRIDDPTLVDLTGLPFVSIDGESSRDLDQALFIEETDDGGGYLVHYALADASFYAPVGSAIFSEALRRGATIYLPGAACRMLPAELSEGVVSLNPLVDRRAVVLQVPLRGDGAPAGATRAVRARVRSRAKLSFSGVQRFFDAPGESPLAGTPFAPSLVLLERVGALLRARAAARHVIDCERGGAHVVVDPATGGLLGEPVKETDCDRFNAQISILANTEAAALLGSGGDSADGVVQPIFKVCAPPDAVALRRLKHDLDDIVRDADVPPAEAASWRWDGALPLQEYLLGLPSGGRGARERLRCAITRQATLVGGGATYSATAAVHYGVGASAYTRFTAPMREVVGVFVHKELLEAIAGRGADPAEDRALRERVIAAAAAAKAAQSAASKAAYKLFLDGLLAEDLGKPVAQRPWRRATVMGRKQNLCFVTLDEPAGAEVKLYAPLERQGTGAAAAPQPRIPQLRTGSGVRVRVLSHDDARERYMFEHERLEEAY